MSKVNSLIYRRLNITLPARTVKLMDKVTRGNRSQFIDRAVQQHISQVGRNKIRESLKAQGLEQGARDLAIAAEWYLLEEEPWPKSNH